MRIRTTLLATGAAVLAALIAANAQVPGVNSTLQSIFTLAYEVSTSKPTYSATQLMAMTSTAAGDVCALSGSATKTIRVRRVIVGGVTTVAESNPVAFVKRTGTYTGGGSQMTKVAYSTTYAASGVTAEYWLGTAPTAATLVGYLADVYVGFATAATASGASFGAAYDFGKLAAPVFLRGTSQWLAVNFNGVNYNAANLTCTFEWTEDNDS